MLILLSLLVGQDHITGTQEDRHTIIRMLPFPWFSYRQVTHSCPPVSTVPTVQAVLKESKSYH